jgi:hypothetical protein
VTDPELEVIRGRNLGNEDVLALIGELRGLRSHMCGLLSAVAKDARADERDKCVQAVVEAPWMDLSSSNWGMVQEYFIDAIRDRGEKQP